VPCHLVSAVCTFVECFDDVPDSDHMAGMLLFT